MPSVDPRIEYERRQAADAWRHAEAAATPRDALAWLERAHRFVPGDQNIAFSLALNRLADGAAAAALELFASIGARHPTRAVRCGIAAACLALGRVAEAEAAIGAALAESTPDPLLAGLAHRVGEESRLVRPARRRHTAVRGGVSGHVPAGRAALPGLPTAAYCPRPGRRPAN
ncbi:MAG: CDC27 family protein [Rhodospirillales bacterium]